MSQVSLAETALCGRFGHFWCKTKLHGKYRCHNCNAVAYCSRCLLVFPANVQTILCKKHKDETMHNRNDQRPIPPDMLPSGSPHVTTLRRSLHRTTEDPNSEPGTVATLPQSCRPGKRTFFVVASVFIMLLGLFLFWQQAVLPWWTGMQDQWNYGSSRITQLDANVGHGGESHFIAEYYRGAIIVIELSLTNPSDQHIYTLTGFEGNNTTAPVLVLSIADVNHDGEPDLVIQIGGTSIQMVLYNTGTAFSKNEG